MNFKGGLLLDESVNLGDVSTSSFGTPLPAKRTPDPDDSPIIQPQFTAKDNDIGQKQAATPPLLPDDKALAGSKDAGVDAPQHIPERDRTPTLREDSEPQTPSRRPKIHITMETETITVSI